MCVPPLLERQADCDDQPAHQAHEQYPDVHRASLVHTAGSVRSAPRGGPRAGGVPRTGISDGCGSTMHVRSHP
jgi:hypothetical protein